MINVQLEKMNQVSVLRIYQHHQRIQMEVVKEVLHVPQIYLRRKNAWQASVTCQVITGICVQKKEQVQQKRVQSIHIQLMKMGKFMCYHLQECPKEGNIKSVPTSTCGIDCVIN